MAAVPKKRIGEMLLEAGIIDETQLKAALGHQRQWGVRLGQALVDLKLATEADIVRALSLKFGFEVAKLDALEPYGHEQALKLFPREFTLRNNVFPMWADTANVTVAMSDPTNLAVVDEVRFRTGRRVKVCIGGDQEVAHAIKRYYPGDGDVEAIALDLDADSGVAGEAVFDPFGGGSKDALEAFFGGPGDGAPLPEAAAAAPPPEPEPPVPPRPPQAQARPPPQSPPQPQPQPQPQPRTQAPAQAQQPRPAAPRTGTALPAQPAPAKPPAGAPRPPLTAPTAAPRTGTATPAQRPPAAAAPAPTPAAAPAPPKPALAAPPGPTRPAAPPRPAAAAPAPPAAAQARKVELELEEKTGEHGEAATEELTPFDEPTGETVLATDVGMEEMVEGRMPTRELTDHELAILESLDRLASGAPAQPDIVKPAQAMAALIRLLIRRRIVTEQEFLDELSKK
jgi:hypothetical protein